MNIAVHTHRNCLASPHNFDNRLWPGLQFIEYIMHATDYTVARTLQQNADP